MKARSKTLSVISVASLLVLAAGCGSDGATSDGPTEVVFQNQFTDAEHALMQELVKRFEQEHDDIEVRLVRDNDTSYYDKLVTQITAGQGPDIVRVDPPHAVQYVEAGWTAPLDDVLDEQTRGEFFQNSLESVTKDGTLYGVPNDISTLALFYRTDLFEQAGLDGPPETWEELVANAQALTEGDRYGIGLFGGWGAFEFYPWLWQAGASLVADDGTSGLDTPEALAALELWTELQETAMPPGMATATEDDVKGPFISGQLAMLTSGPWVVPSLQDAGIDGTWAIAPLPAGADAASVLGGLHLQVLENSDVKDEAKTFIQWLISDDIQTEWASELGYLPIKQTLYESPEFADDEVVQAFMASLEQSRVRPAIPTVNQLEEALAGAIEAALSGAASPEQALQEAAATSDKILAQ